VALAAAIREHTDFFLNPLPTLLPAIAKLIGPRNPSAWITDVITATGPKQVHPEEPPDVLVSSRNTVTLKKLIPAFDDFAQDPTTIQNAFTGGVYENGNPVRIDAFLNPSRNLGTLRFRTFDDSGRYFYEEIFNFKDEKTNDPKDYEKGLLTKLFAIIDCNDPNGMRGIRAAAYAAHSDIQRDTPENEAARRDRLELRVLNIAECERIVKLPSGAQILLEVATSIAALQIRSNDTPNATATTWVVEKNGDRPHFSAQVQTLRDAVTALQSSSVRTVFRTVKNLEDHMQATRSTHIQTALPCAIFGFRAVDNIRMLGELKIEAAEPVSSQAVADLLQGRETVDIYFANSTWSRENPDAFSNLRISVDPKGGAYIRLTNLMHGSVHGYLSPQALTKSGGIDQVAMRLSSAFMKQVITSRLTPQRDLEQLALTDPGRSWCLAESDGNSLRMPESSNAAGNRAYDAAASLFRGYQKLPLPHYYPLEVTYSYGESCEVNLQDRGCKTELSLTVTPQGINYVRISGPHPSNKDHIEECAWSIADTDPPLPILTLQILEKLLKEFRFYSLTRYLEGAPAQRNSGLHQFVHQLISDWLKNPRQFPS
jgi:hypothetical protein